MEGTNSYVWDDRYWNYIHYALDKEQLYSWTMGGQGLMEIPLEINYFVSIPKQFLHRFYGIYLTQQESPRQECLTTTNLPTHHLI
jgi:hypothetical protein